MQAITAAPRNHLTEATVVRLLRDAPAITVGHGLELIGQDLQLVEDISADLAGGQVSRNSYATLHATCQLALSRALSWGSALVRPYMTISDGQDTARFNLGAYYTSTPTHRVGEDPVTYDVAGYDILHGLHSPVGEAYAVDAGVGYLAAVEAILQGQGYTRYLIDQRRGDAVLPSAKVWALDDQTRWLTVVNDLLAAIGYQGIWSDWDGQLRCQPYQRPADRAPEWLYDDRQATSMVGLNRDLERDFFEAPNRWVFVRQNDVDGPPPVEGDGVYTWTNTDVGDTSVEARGRVLTKVVYADAADQAALEAAGQVTIDADMRIPTALRVTTSPNPLHWHFDRLIVDEPALGPYADVMATSWTLPLDGSDMTHEWTSL
ncbi:hypothetical protein [Verrucosispora sp. WMMC514]|uniref:hypothetical protein n=1 Tax=Verrucosispora sp. WMMC514 TaxID=3015156 RepID=UPI00248CA493|nr:hypothetical protein [Verrucosispora sp. WMMC514]WBB94175.1 hypothetical protein O7597_15100 [Verrucosispora sp. WMMC514]